MLKGKFAMYAAHSDNDDEEFLLDNDNCEVSNEGNAKCLENKTNTSANGYVKGASARDLPNLAADVVENAPLLTNTSFGDDFSNFHCHDSYSHHHDSTSWVKLSTVTIICAIFMVAEIVGGYMAGSLAILTDAGHLFSDLVSFLISLLSMWWSKKSADKVMTFGYHRAEVLGALLSVLSIWFLAAVFLVLAIRRIINSDFEINADIMLILASVGLLMNIIMGIILHGFCQKHGHSHHGISTNDENINVRAAAAHVLGDLLQSLGVLVAAIVISAYPSAKVADPICTIVFSVVIVVTTAPVARDSILILLEGNAKNISDLVVHLQNISGVRNVHDMHVWSLAPGKDAAAVHLIIDSNCDRDIILKKSYSIVKSRLNIISCTVQIEKFNSELTSSCKNCTVQCL